MGRFARFLTFAVVAGMINLTMADAIARSAGGNGGSGTGGTGTGGAGTGGAGTGGTGAGGAGGGGPAAHALDGMTAFSVDSGACATLRLSDPAGRADALEGLADISRQTRSFIARCGCATSECVAAALDQYADALEKVAPRLPPAIRALPRIVRQAASQARAAPSVPVAIRALHVAVAAVTTVVHKTIQFIRAGDPDTAQQATRGAALVAGVLDTAATALERADTL